MKYIKRFIAFSVLAWILGFFYYTFSFSIAMPEKINTRTDAIVVLTGGNNRIQKGMELFSERLSPNLFITGVHPIVSKEELINNSSVKIGLPECCIIIGHQAKTTQENALETKNWAIQNNINSIRLVTSDYHMPRALFEFKQAMPTVKFLSNPVRETQLKLTDLLYWQILVGEYNKIIYRNISTLLNKEK